MEMFNSIEDANAASVMNTLSAANKAGFTEQVNDEGHVLCSVPGTTRLIDIHPDGSWEYQEVKDDGEMETMEGDSAAVLAVYLHGEASGEQAE